MAKGKKPSAHRQEWSKEEDAYLKKRICAADDRKDIAKAMHRTKASVDSRVYNIGLSIPRVQKQESQPKKRVVLDKKSVVARKKSVNSIAKYKRLMGEFVFFAEWNGLQFENIELMKDGTGIIARFKG